MKHRFLILFTLLIIVPAMILLNLTPVYSTIRNSTISLLQPAFEKTYFVIYNFTDGLARMADYPLLTKKNAKLNSENTRLKKSLVRLTELESENKRLRSLLDLKDNNPQLEKSALVIGRDISLWSKCFLINRGHDDAMHNNTPLLSPAGLVGRVMSVGKNSSQCIMIIDRRSKVSTLIQRTRDIGIVEGTDDGLLKMRYLSLKADVEIGDIIITSGLGGIYPKGLPIGTVITVSKDTNGLHLFAKIRPFVDFNKLEEVICLSA